MDHLIPATDIAKAMTKPARNASTSYLNARKELLIEEIELRRQMERVAERRRALPPGPAIAEDYVFTGVDASGAPTKVKLSELFCPGTNGLLIYNYMFPRHATDTREPAKTGATAKLPVRDQPCPSCTGLLDQLNAAAPHFEAGGGNFAVIAKTSIENLVNVARDRDWQHLRLLSSHDNNFRRDYHAEDENGQQLPIALAFKRDEDGTIRLFWSSDLIWVESDPGQDPRAAGTIEPFWNMFDLLPNGRPAFDEQMQYDCCHRER